MPKRRVRRNERTHKSGSIKDLGEGRVRAWRPPQDGKRPSKLFTGPDARAQAEAWLKGIEPSASMPLGQWCELWSARRWARLAETSRQRYKEYFGYLKPLADRPLDSITDIEWQAHLDLLLFGDQRVPKEERVVYALGTVRRARGIWSAALSAAVRASHLRANPLLDTHLPKAGDQPPKAWRLDEQRRLLAAVVGKEHEAWLHTGLATGMRFGELRALEVDDVDFIRLTVLVSKSMDNANQVGPTKSRNARLIPLAPEAAAVLAAKVKRLQPGARLVLGHTDGRPFGRSTLRTWLARMCKKAGVAPLTPHAMRHSYASTSIADGVDLAALSHDLGHADIGITSRIYSHYITQRDRPTARAVSRQLYGQVDPPESGRERSAQ